MAGQEYRVGFPIEIWKHLAGSHESRELREAIASELGRQGLKEPLLVIKHKTGAENQFPVDVVDGALIEGNIVRSANFLFSDVDNQIWLDVDDKIRCIIELSPFDNVHVPYKFSTQYLEKLCDSEPTMYMSGVDFVEKGTLRETYFTSGTFFKVRLTAELVEFLRENALHFKQLHADYQAVALFFWLNKREFAIYDRAVVNDFEDRLRRNIGWETIRSEINKIRLLGETEV